MRVAVVGARGTIGPAIARDLTESEEVSELVLLDREDVDAADAHALAAAIDGCALVVNAASYRLNLSVMAASLAAGCAYVDLGGLYHVTARQLALDGAFADAGLLAVLGCGAAPGKTNVMASVAAGRLDSVDAVRCASAGLDLDPPPGFWTPYAVETLVDEVTLAPVVVRDGAATELAPLTDGGTIAFPDPIGSRESIYTLHSEVLTLPASLGASACDFRLSLAADVRERLVAGATDGRSPPSAQTWSAQRVDVSGTRAGARATVAMTAITRPHARWGLGGGVVSTASVAAATVRLVARGEVARAGVHPPEQVLPADALLAELESRGCRFEIEA